LCTFEAELASGGIGAQAFLPHSIHGADSNTFCAFCALVLIDFSTEKGKPRQLPEECSQGTEMAAPESMLPEREKQNQKE